MEKRKETEQRRLQRENDKKLSIHHIINKASKDLFSNLNDSENLKEKTWGKHRRRHIAHENEHPLETLQNTRRFMQVMSEEATKLYEALISMSPEKFYKNKFIKWNQ